MTGSNLKPGLPLADPQTAGSGSIKDGPAVDAIIVGAGLAGLAAARCLKRNGASVRVLESRDRVGGRVQSQRLTSGHVIDLGAQLFGDAQTRISALVDEVGLMRVARNHVGDAVHISSPGAEPVLARGGSLPLSSIGKLDALQALWSFDRRLKSFRADIDHLDEMTASKFITARTFTRAPTALLNGFVEGELCAPLDEVSAYELLDQSASVGGFDGERALSAARGAWLRQELGWRLADSGQELYLGVDHGQVGGAASENLVGTRLTGAVIGLRGGYRQASWDAFLGRPVQKPGLFRTADYTAGFSFNLSF